MSASFCMSAALSAGGSSADPEADQRVVPKPRLRVQFLYVLKVYNKVLYLLKV